MSTEQISPESPLDQAAIAVRMYDFYQRRFDDFQPDTSAATGLSQGYYAHQSRIARVDMMTALAVLGDDEAGRLLASSSSVYGDDSPVSTVTIAEVRTWRAVLGGGGADLEISEVARDQIGEDLRYRQMDTEADKLFDTDANFRETIDAIRHNPEISAADMAHLARIVAASVDYTPEPQLGNEINTREGAISAIETCMRTHRACERWEQAYEDADDLDDGLERVKSLESEIGELRSRAADIEAEWGVGEEDADALEELQAKLEELQAAVDTYEELRGEISEHEDEQAEVGNELGRSICAEFLATHDEDGFHRLYTVLKDDPRVSSDVVIDVAWVLTGQEHEDRDQALGAIEGEFYARAQGQAQEQAQGHGR